MASVNKAILVGRVGREPEVRSFAGGGRVANLSLATDRRWKDKQTGERRQETEWHRLSVGGNLAGVVEQYVHKGSLLYVEGSLRTRKWQGKDGTDRYTTEIRVYQLQMLDGNRAPAEQPKAAEKAGGDGDWPGEDAADDIPFN